MAIEPKPRKAAAPAKPRNLVVLLDGTGNELGRNLSNVLKLYRIAEKGEEQLCFYNPGVGTISRINPWRRFQQTVNGVLGLATGYGLDETVLSAYSFLVRNWREGDRIFLFGFSRGAWSARILAGMLHLIGLLRPEQLNMCDSALGTYKQAANQHDLPLAWHFSRVIGARYPNIHFVGVWDTVGSVLVPRPDRMWLPSLELLPYTRTNPSVKIFRHACALDERRRMFRLAHWKQPQDYVPNRFKPKVAQAQDIEQRWFAGVHADVGGGYPEKESGLSKFPLGWMTREAEKAGLRISEANFRHLVEGEMTAPPQHPYVAPNARAKLHKSLTWAWWVLEVLPKRIKYREWKRWSLLGRYLPLGEPRKVRAGAVIDPSVRERMAEVKSYRPVNLD
ncbi:MAG: DUF2235 domain-containing protein [Novosphingobium sp.]